MSKALANQSLNKGRLANHLGMFLGPLALVLLLDQMAGWTGDERSYPLISVLSVLAKSVPYAGLWLGAALVERSLDALLG